MSCEWATKNGTPFDASQGSVVGEAHGSYPGSKAFGSYTPSYAVVSTTKATWTFGQERTPEPAAFADSVTLDIPTPAAQLDSWNAQIDPGFVVMPS